MQTAQPLLIHKFKLSNRAGDCRPFENSLGSTVHTVEIHFPVAPRLSQTMPPYACASNTDRNVLLLNVTSTDVDFSFSNYIHSL